MFKPLSLLEKICGSTEDVFFPIWGFDQVCVGDVYYIVPINEKGKYDDVAATIIKTLRDLAVPTDKNVLTQLILQSPKLLGVEYDSAFVDNVLADNLLVDVFKDGLIQIKDKYLSNETQRRKRASYQMNGQP